MECSTKVMPSGIVGLCAGFILWVLLTTILFSAPRLPSDYIPAAFFSALLLIAYLMFIAFVIPVRRNSRTLKNDEYKTLLGDEIAVILYRKLCKTFSDIGTYQAIKEAKPIAVKHVREITLLGFEALESIETDLSKE